MTVKIKCSLLLLVYALIHCSAAYSASDWPISSGSVISTRYSDQYEINKGNVHTLQKAWTYRVSKFSSVDSSVQENTVESTPIFTSKYVISVDLASRVYALDPTTGKEVWKTKVSTPVGRRGIAYSDGFVYVGTSDGVKQIDEESGEIRKTFGSSLSFIAPIVLKETIFIANYVGGIEAYRVKDGQQLWSQSLSSKCGMGRVWSGFSFDHVSNNLFVVTGNSGALTERDPKNCFSNSVVAISAGSGDIKWQFQEFEHDMWDLDMVAHPILATVTSNGYPVRIVVALSKTGSAYMIDVHSGKLLNGSETIQRSGKVKRVVPGMSVSGLAFSESNIKFTDAQNNDYIARKLTHFKKFDFTGASPQQPVFFYGLHGGFEWPGGSLFEPGNILVAASNSYPWIVRVGHRYRDHEKITNLVSRSKPLVENCVACHSKDLLGRISSELDKPGGGYYIPPILRPGGDEKLLPEDVSELQNQHKFGRHEAKPFFSQERLYQDAEHILWRALKKIDRSLNTDWVHRLFLLLFQFCAPSNTELDLVLDKLARLNSDQLKVIKAEIAELKLHLEEDQWETVAHWQMITDLQDRPVNSPPWGYLNAIDLSTRSIAWRVPFGYEMDKLGNKIAGSRNMGGVLTTKSGLIFATGAVDRMARAYDLEDGTELWSDKLKAAGSAPPMTYAYKGCQYVVFTSTGGRFSFFGPNGRDIELVAYKLPSCVL